MDFEAGPLMRRRTGVGGAIIAIIIVIVLAIAGVGAYYALTPSKASSTTSHVSSTSSATTTSSSTIASTTKSSQASSTSSTSTTSTSTNVTYYSGAFNFTLVLLGPSGVRSLPNGSAQYYNSTQVGSGTFTFGLAAGGLTGSGSGNGTFTITTQGFCTGSETIHYTFAITDVTTLLGNNMTIFFGNPTPANYTVPLTCTGDMTGVSTATNNPGPYLAVYPNEWTIPLTSLPLSEVFHGTPAADQVWWESLKETS